MSRDIKWTREAAGRYSTRRGDVSYDVIRQAIPMLGGHEWIVVKRDDHARRVLATHRHVSVMFPDATRAGFLYLNDAKQFVAELVDSEVAA